jgi:hypothetical protein
MIGASFGLFQSALFAGIYMLTKKLPILQKIPGAKWAMESVDSWVQAAKRVSPEKSARYNLAVGFCSKSLWLVGTGAVLGFGADLFKTYKNTHLNGKISNTKQGAVQDSWLLAGLNSLARTKEGKKIITNSMRVNDDDSITIKFKGIDREYNVTRKELKDANKAYITRIGDDGKVKGFKKKYSKGDGDVLAFELALEKYHQDLKDGVVQPSENVPSYVTALPDENKDLLSSGSSKQFLYLLTGKECSQIDTQTAKSSSNDKSADVFNMYSKSYLNKFLEDYGKNPDKYYATVNLTKGDGEKLVLRDKHMMKVALDTANTYSIKSIDSKYVTLVNPKQSSHEYELSIKTLKDNMASLTYANVNDSNSSDKILQKYADIVD